MEKHMIGATIPIGDKDGKMRVCPLCMEPLTMGNNTKEGRFHPACDVLRVSIMDTLFEYATDYIETLERDRRIIAARYIARLKEKPNVVSDMGFLQFVEYKLNDKQNGS